MKTICQWTLVLFCCLLSTRGWSQRVKPCNVFGTVIYVKDKSQADFSVFVEETESFANLVVFLEDNPLYADKSGVWYVTNNPRAAQYRVYVEPMRGQADFTVHYTENRSFAGCN